MHRVYDGRKNSDRPRTLIFRVLRWHDRSEILKGARQAYPVKYTQDNVTLLFFPDFSPATAAKRKSLVPVLRSMTALGLQPFLAYPAVIKLRHGGEQRSFDSLRKVEDFISSLSQMKAFAAAPQGSGKASAALSSAWQEGLDGRDRGDAGCPEEDGGGRDMYACYISFFLSSFLSPPGILLIFIPYTCLFAGKTNPPFFSFFFWRGLMESRFNYNNCLCFSLCVIFIFYNRHSYFYLLYLIFGRIFHLGGLISRMHTSDYISFAEWECFCFSSFTEYNFGLMNIQCML